MVKGYGGIMGDPRFKSQCGQKKITFQKNKIYHHLVLFLIILIKNLYVESCMLFPIVRNPIFLNA